MKYKSTAVLGEKCFKHFNIHPVTATMYGVKKEDIINVILEIADEQTVPEANPIKGYTEADYWGWFNFKDKRFVFIYAQYFLLNMCFPAGIQATDKQGEGKAYRLIVTKI